MFGSLGATEILVLAVIGLLVFGPRRLPEMGRNLGRTLYEFRKAAMELRTSVEREINLEELKQAGQTLREGAREGASLLSPPPVAATPRDPAASPARPGVSTQPAAPWPDTAPPQTHPAQDSPVGASPESVASGSPGGSPPESEASDSGAPPATARPDGGPGTGNVVPKG